VYVQCIRENGCIRRVEGVVESPEKGLIRGERKKGLFAFKPYCH